MPSKKLVSIGYKINFLKMGAVNFYEKDYIAEIILSNPNKANAIDLKMLEELKEIISHIHNHPSLRVIIIKGEGDNHFSSGADINEWSSMKPEHYASEWIKFGNDIFDSLEKLPQVLIASINGTCYGGGLELALCADIRIAVENAYFCLPENGIGVIPGWKGSVRLKEIVGLGKANDLILTARIINASTAQEWGLINYKFPKDRFKLETLIIAKNVSKNSPISIQASKQLLRSNSKDNYAHEKLSKLCKNSFDGQEGISSFFEKRKPIFKGRL